MADALEHSNAKIVFRRHLCDTTISPITFTSVVAGGISRKPLHCAALTFCATQTRNSAPSDCCFPSSYIPAPFRSGNYPRILRLSTPTLHAKITAIRSTGLYSRYLRRVDTLYTKQRLRNRRREPFSATHLVYHIPSFTEDI
jgi:hypothetical protein